MLTHVHISNVYEKSAHRLNNKIFFSSYTATIFKTTNQNTSDRLRVGGFGLEIWNIGDDMTFKYGDSYIFHFK